jgi:hypothetical protein
MNIGIDTRPFPFPTWSGIYNKVSLAGHLERRHMEILDIYIHMLYQSLIHNGIAQGVDNSDRSNTKYWVGLKGRDPVPSKGVWGLPYAHGAGGDRISIFSFFAEFSCCDAPP